MVALFLLPAGACNAPSRYTLSNIKLTETERAWKNPEEKNSELVKLYDGMTCSGTMVVATDKDVIYLYAEKDVEKDGKTLESQDTVFDLGSCSKTFTARRARRLLSITCFT